MDHPNKRILTEGAREISAATTFALTTALTTGVTEDLTLRLQNVGPRVRHSVSQGYQTAPSQSHSFVKSQSTGSIFRSMNDILCDVRKETSFAEAHSHDSGRKRSHCAEQDTDLDPNMQINVYSSEEGVTAETLNTKESSPSSLNPRPMKNINRTFHQARSLPTWSPSLSQLQPTEEDDWSCDIPQTSEQQFKPMEL